MNKTLETGDRAILQLNNGETYEGTIIEMTKNYIELEDIYLGSKCNGRSKLKGLLKFYRRETASVRYLIPKGNHGSSATPSDSDSNHSSNTKAIKLLLENEFHQLQEMTRNTIYFDMRNKAYYDALDVLINCESIGVVGVGSTFTRKPLSLLFVSDFKQIYIFDMMSGNIQSNDLRGILESKYITKVVHKVGPLYDCLFHKYRIKLTNIFDTQIADSRISQKDTGKSNMRSLSECMEHYFNFPSSLLDAAMDDLSDDDCWIQRPIIKNQRVKGAQLVVYLLTLRDHLLKRMLSDFHDEIGKKCDFYEKLSDFELVQHTSQLKLK